MISSIEFSFLVEDLADDELDMIEDQPAKVEEFYEKHETKVEVIEDFEAYEEMHTIVTESVRSGSLTSLEGTTKTCILTLCNYNGNSN